MEIFSKIFFIAASGLFILLFMLLIEHPKRNMIGWTIFGFVTLLIIGSIPILAIISPLCPLFVLLDLKRLSLKTCLIYIGAFFLVFGVWATFIFNSLPFYYYPILVFLYVLIAKFSFDGVQKKEQLKEII